MLFSVIIPCYNVEKYIDKCLNSVFKNNLRGGVELIIINDGSTDNTLDRLCKYFMCDDINEAYGLEYKGAKIWIFNRENNGVSSARNFGLSVAQGKYILFFDGDDYIADDYFEKLGVFISGLDCIPEMIIMGYKRRYEDNVGLNGETVNIYPHKNYCADSNRIAVEQILPMYLGLSAENIKENTTDSLEFGSVWRIAYNRVFLVDNKISFNCSIKLNEDSMFNANCIARANHIRTFNECFYFYTIRPTGAMRKNRGVALVDNKLALLNERLAILSLLNEHGYNFSISDIAGSNVLSVLELMSKCHLKEWKILKRYVKSKNVKKSIKIVSFADKLKFDVSLALLKCRMYWLTFFLIRIAIKLGAKASF